MTAHHRVLDESDLSLIDRVKQTPSLYNPTHPDFRLAFRKDQDWERVGSFLGLEAVDARRRWTCLRDRYSRELRQLRMHPEKRAYGQNHFFRQMDFLRRFVRKRRERKRNQYYESSWVGSIDDLKKDQSGDEQFEEDIQNQFETKIDVPNTEIYQEFAEDELEAYEFKCNQSPQKAEVDSLLPIMMLSDNSAFTLAAPAHVSANMQVQNREEQQQLPQSLPEDAVNENGDEFFCKSIAAYLRQLSRRHKIKAKVEMFQILEKYIDLEENLSNQNS